MTLRPSAFYAAAGLRTSALREPISRAALANLSLGAHGRRRDACLGQIGPHGNVVAMCQQELCGLTGCNLNQ